MKRFSALLLAALIFTSPFLSAQNAVSAGTETGEGEGSVTGEDALSSSLTLYSLEAARSIKKLNPGDYTLILTGPLNTNTLAKITKAMAKVSGASFNLDLSQTTALYELEKDVLANCPSLKSLTLSDAIIRISFFAFMGSSNLTHIHAPEGNESFSSIDGILYTKDFSRLTLVPPGRSGRVVVSQLAKEVEGTAFSLSPRVSEIQVEERTVPQANPPLMETKSDYFESVDGLLYSLDHSVLIRCPAGRDTPVQILSTVRGLAPHAFENCTHLSEILLPSGLERVEYGAFALCTSLTDISFPQSVIYIGKQAFYGCTSLNNFSVPASVNYLGSRSFFKSDIRSLLFEVQEGWIYGRKSTKSLENPVSNAAEFSHPGRYWSYDLQKGDGE